MNRRSIFLVCGTGLLLAGLACGSLAEAPGQEPNYQGAPPVAPTGTAVIQIPVTGGGGDEAPTPIPALPETRSLTLEWPPRVRVGDGDTIRLTLEVDERGAITPTAEIEGHLTTMQVVEIPNLYDTHSVLAEARLDLAGMTVQPAGVVSQSLLPGQSVTFYWSIYTSEAGVYRGRVWLYLRFLPLDGGPDSSRTVAAPPVEVQASTLLGLHSNTARWIGGIGSFIGTVFSIPFLEDILRLIGRRGKRKAA